MTGHLRQVIDAVGLSSKVAKARFAEIESLFERSVQLEVPESALGLRSVRAAPCGQEPKARLSSSLVR